MSVPRLDGKVLGTIRRTDDGRVLGIVVSILSPFTHPESIREVQGLPQGLTPGLTPLMLTGTFRLR